jgi:hypothetical protein
MSLRRPVPLDQALALHDEEDGKVCAFADEDLVVEAVPATPLLA